MTDQFNSELAEQIADKKFLEATERLAELEQKDLNEIFPTLGDVVSRVEAGDRVVMLELLIVTARSLRHFEALPQQTREALADGLETMQSNLEEAKGFLPRGRGQDSVIETRQKHLVEFSTALGVEWKCHFEGFNLEDAIAGSAEETGLSESLIQKHWKRRHKEAKESLALMQLVSAEAGMPMPAKLPRKKSRR